MNITQYWMNRKSEINLTDTATCSKPSQEGIRPRLYLVRTQHRHKTELILNRQVNNLFIPNIKDTPEALKQKNEANIFTRTNGNCNLWTNEEVQRITNTASTFPLSIKSCASEKISLRRKNVKLFNSNKKEPLSKRHRNLSKTFTWIKTPCHRVQIRTLRIK